MPLILLTFVLSATSLFVEFVIYVPQQLTSVLHPPVWLGLTVLFLIFSWVMGE
jgi:hypothetical protein